MILALQYVKKQFFCIFSIVDSLLILNWHYLNFHQYFLLVHTLAPLTRTLGSVLVPESVQKLWNNWEIRVLVLISLTLQLSLFHFGRQRRYNVKTWIHIFLWLCYLVADSVATVALGVISSKQRNSGNDSKFHNELMTFWAPFMLLHLGGQDTITAFAIQDNELWFRHLLGLIVQSSVAFYIFITSLKVSLKDHWLLLHYSHACCWVH